MTMRWLVDPFLYVLEHSRAQFRPAALALMMAIPMVVIIEATVLVLSLFLDEARILRLPRLLETYATVFGPVLFGELVRGHIKVGLGYRPEEWCFPAVGLAGLMVGCLFGAMMALKWGRGPWLELSRWGGGMAAAYLLIAWTLYRDEKRKAAVA